VILSSAGQELLKLSVNTTWLMAGLHALEARTKELDNTAGD
jgi:hypothetical protein